MVEAVDDGSGAPCALVGDPDRAPLRAYAGCERDPALDGEPEYRRKFKLCKHVRKASHDLLSAVKAGDLVQHGPLVVASGREDAEGKILAVIAAKSE